MKLEDAGMSDGLRVYAIGDVHGCIDELKALLRKINAYEKANRTDALKLVFLGDYVCLLYTSPSPRDLSTSRMPSSA